MNPDLIQVAVDMTRRALAITLELSLPVLLVGMVVGFLVSLLQAVTQIQEQTLSFIPKILAMMAALYLLMPFFIRTMVQYSQEVFLGMKTVTY